MDLPPISHCSGCEKQVNEGDELVLLVTAKVLAGHIKYLTLDTFHRRCWAAIHQEVPLQGVLDGQPPPDHPSPDSPF
jgi:hypothetical protein